MEHIHPFQGFVSSPIVKLINTQKALCAAFLASPSSVGLQNSTSHSLSAHWLAGNQLWGANAIADCHLA